MAHRQEIEALEEALEPLVQKYIAYEQEVDLAAKYGNWLPSDDDALVKVPLGVLRKIHSLLYPNFYSQPQIATSDDVELDLPF
jgi:hypothetical protein